ncbi:MAG: hypothetical protein K2X03_20940 [Bryobacteraceae bacterium]|nr:hypothetical protein [Bryobacteraceae bacterium]
MSGGTRKETESALVTRALGFPLDFERDGKGLPRSLAARQTAHRVAVEWIPKVSDDNLKEMLYRLLIDKEARPVAFQLALRDFCAIPQTQRGNLLRWVVGAALAAMSSSEDAALLKQLVADRRYGIGRQELVLKLSTLLDPAESLTLGRSLLDDPDVRLHALNCISKSARKGSEEARRALQEVSTSNDSFLQKEATKRLKKLE